MEYNNQKTIKDLSTQIPNPLDSSDISDTITISSDSHDDFFISAGSEPSINWNWNSSIISPITSLTTDQISSLNQISIQPLTTGTLSTPPYIVATNTGQVLTTGTNGTTGWGGITGLSNALDVKGDANFEGDVKIKGKSLVESLEKIEEKLAILRPNEQLEEKWEKLRELRKLYIECEKDIIEKEKIWETLKK